MEQTHDDVLEDPSPLSADPLLNQFAIRQLDAKRGKDYDSIIAKMIKKDAQAVST